MAISWQLRGLRPVLFFLAKITLCSSYTLLKSDVTSRDHVVCCRGSQECGSRFCQFRLSISLAMAQFLHNSEIYNIVIHAQ